MKYVAKPIAVDAIQWTIKNGAEFMSFIWENVNQSASFHYSEDDKDAICVCIKFPSIFHLVGAGDWVVCKDGEIKNIYSDEAFRKIYEVKE